MKALKSGVALLLATLLLVIGLPLSAIGLQDADAATSPGENLSMLNDGTDLSKFQTSDLTGAFVDSNHIGPDQSAYAAQIFTPAYEWSKWSTIAATFDKGGISSDAEAVVFWIDFSELSVPSLMSVYFQSSQPNADGTGTEYANVLSFNTDMTVHLVPFSQGTQSTITGHQWLPIPQGFAGYVVIEYDFTQINVSSIDRIQLGRQSNGSTTDPDDYMLRPEDAGKTIYFDNIATLSDVESFLQNPDQYGTLRPSLNELPVLIDDTLHYPLIAGASQYHIAFYDALYGFAGAQTSVSSTAEVTLPDLARYVQVSAYDASYNILAVTPIAAVYPGQVYTLLNDGSEKESVTIENNFFMQDNSSEPGTSPDGTHWNFYYHTTPGYNQWAKMKIDIATAQALGSVEAYAFYVDFSNIQNPENKLGWSFSLLDSEGNALSGAFAENQTCYFISAEDESVSSGTMRTWWGLAIPGGFVGYVIVPTQNTGIDYSSAASFYMTQGDSPLTEGSPDVGKTYIIDNIMAIHNLAAFEELAPAGLGAIPSDGTWDAPATSLREGGLTVSFDPVSGAVRYEINIYNPSFVLIDRVETATVQASVDVSSEVWLQLVARDVSGQILRVSQLKFADAANFKVLNSGSSLSNIISTDAAINVATGEFPDGAGLSVLTTRNGYTQFGFSQIDLASFEAIAFYVDLRQEGTGSSWTFNDIYDTTGKKVTDVIYEDVNMQPYARGVFAISAEDGSVQDLKCGWEDGNLYIPRGFAGYIVYEIDQAVVGNHYSVSGLRVQSSNWHSNSAEENQGQPMYLDNLAVISDLDYFCENLNVASLGFCKPSGNFDAPEVSTVESTGNQATALIEWNAVSGANSYLVSQYALENGEPVYAGQSTVTNCEFSLSGQPDDQYALQIIALDASGEVLANSQLATVVLRQIENYLLLNDCSDTSAVISDFAETQRASDVFPDGKGLSMKTNRGGSITFTFNEIDLAQYDAIAYYISFAMDETATGYTMADIYDIMENKVTNLTYLPVSGQPMAQNAIAISAKDGSIVNLSCGWENGSFNLDKDFAGYIILSIDKTAIGLSHKISDLTVRAHGWHQNSNPVNQNQTMYLDNLAVIRDLDAFLESTSAERLGYLSPSSGATEPSLQATQGLLTSEVECAVEAVPGAASYDFHVYTFEDEKPVYSDLMSVTSEINSADITVAAGQKVAVQVIAKNAAGEGLNVSEVGVYDNSAVLPHVVGGSFNESRKVRFQCTAPLEIVPGYTVVEYGAVMLPTQLLDGELTLETSGVTVGASEETPALGSTYYASINGAEEHPGVRISARAYITYEDSSGNQITLYSNETISRSVNKMARDMATAVLSYYDAYSLVTTWTEAVPEGTTAAYVAATDPANVSGEDLATFVLGNSAAVEKAASIRGILIDSDTALKETNGLKYVYENDTYVYGINRYGKEVISYKEDNGDYFDVTDGGGAFTLVDTNGTKLAQNSGVSAFYQTVIDGVPALIVEYAADGATADSTEMQTTYLFRQNTISVEASVQYDGTGHTVSASNSSFRRGFSNGYESVEKTFNTDWIYPENGDYPYKYMDSWITKHMLDDTHKVYTFNRGDIPIKYWNFYVRYPEKNLPLNFTDANNIDYTLTYDLVLERADAGYDADYLALFKGRDSDFAARVTPVGGNDDNTTLFVDDAVTLNLNITNIARTSVSVNLNYQVMDYYGNVVASGIYNPTVGVGQASDYTVTISADQTGYGMYFLNWQVTSGNYTHKEYYPFALLDDYTYQYNATSPFGIVQILGEDDISYDDSFSIVNKIGIASTRGAYMSSTYARNIEFLQKAKQKGIRIIPNGGLTDEKAQNYGAYFEDFIAGNEQNLASINGQPMDTVFQNYYDEFFAPSEIMANKYNKNHVIAGVSAGQTAWYQKLYDEGLWNQFEKISLHSYGIPYAPDNVSMLPYTWSMEGGLIRTVNALETLGDKPFMLDETGYHTAPDLRSVDLRTQADYNTRCFILGTSYGAEYTGTYCLLDYSNGGVGTILNDMEYHFGNFYYPDYYGRILPKPAGIAFAFMTRQLEGVTDITECEGLGTSEERIFKATTQNKGTIYVAWSNCGKLGNDTSSSSGLREPTMPWENQWEESTTVNFYAQTGSTVTVTDEMGKQIYSHVMTEADGGVIAITLTGATVYISGVQDTPIS